MYRAPCLRSSRTSQRATEATHRRYPGAPLFIPNPARTAPAGASSQGMGPRFACAAPALRSRRDATAPRRERATDRWVRRTAPKPNRISHARFSQKSASYGTACLL